MRLGPAGRAERRAGSGGAVAEQQLRRRRAGSHAAARRGLGAIAAGRLGRGREARRHRPRHRGGLRARAARLVALPEPDPLSRAAGRRSQEPQRPLRDGRGGGPQARRHPGARARRGAGPVRHDDRGGGRPARQLGDAGSRRRAGPRHARRRPDVLRRQGAAQRRGRLSDQGQEGRLAGTRARDRARSAPPGTDHLRAAAADRQGRRRGRRREGARPHRRVLVAGGGSGLSRGATCADRARAGAGRRAGLAGRAGRSGGGAGRRASPDAAARRTPCSRARRRFCWPATPTRR